MKNVLTVLVGGLLMIGCCVVPRAAEATVYTDDFNDTTMNTSLWSLYSDGVEGDTSLYENEGVLNLTSTGEDRNASKDYVSTWVFDPTHDIMISSQFHYDYMGIGDSALDMGMGTFDLYAGIKAGRYAVGDVETDYFKFRISDTVDGDVLDLNFDRTIDSGYFGLYYNAATDTLNFGVFDDAVLTPEHLVLGYTYNDFSTLDLDPMYAYLGGWSDRGAHLLEGDAYFDDFMAEGSSVVPEPATMALVGLGLIGFMSKRKKIKQ